MSRRRIIIMGAAGRDFHNFNVAFRNDPSFEVVCFTATQIPNISGRRYPAELAGRHYPDGIPIHEEKDLRSLIAGERVAEVIFAYSDVSHEYVMHHASAVNAAGADFRLMGADATMLKARIPVVSVCAVRTGSGKSQTTRRICRLLAARGKRVVAVRHPMPYGDLVRQSVQRFATMEDLDTHECTIEEREEYEPHIRRGTIVYAGV
ncbi:MAG TPA: GTPase, partial [Candidatus Polarisedimenticolia bacterium]|nr:GTPase [Candidatus Polarisedimenticolia bacterium]